MFCHLSPSLQRLIGEQNAPHTGYHFIMLQFLKECSLENFADHVQDSQHAVLKDRCTFSLSTGDLQKFTILGLGAVERRILNGEYTSAAEDLVLTVRDAEWKWAPLDNYRCLIVQHIAGDRYDFFDMCISVSEQQRSIVGIRLPKKRYYTLYCNIGTMVCDPMYCI